MAFTAVVNVLLWTPLLWPQLAGTLLPAAGWTVAGIFWFAGAWRSWQLLPRLCGRGPKREQEALFLEAQAEYLKGHWFEAESLLKRLTTQGADVDAQLMLASLYRHTGQREQARRQLQRLQCLEGGEKWALEIYHERQRLEQIPQKKEVPGEEPPPSTPQEGVHPGASAAA